MAEKLTPFDVLDDLTDDNAIALFLADAIETNDAGYIAHTAEMAERARLRLSTQAKADE